MIFYQFISDQNAQEEPIIEDDILKDRIKNNHMQDKFQNKMSNTILVILINNKKYLHVS